MTPAAFGYGIIGCGWVAPAHAWGVRAVEGTGAALVAVSDVDEARARRLAREFGVPHVYADYRDLLRRDDIQAVSVCLPDFLHRDATIAAAEAGKHVLCEKPLAMTLREADEMIEACRRRGVALGLVMNHRYAPDARRTRRAVRAGAFGRILLGNVVHSSALVGDPSAASPWRGRRGRAAGGVLTTQAIHFLDLLLWFLGPVQAVKAWTARLARDGQDFEDTAVVALRLRSGALAALATTNGAPIHDDFTGTRLELHGTQGYVLLEGDRLRLAMTRGGEELPGVEHPPLPEGAERIVFGAGHVYEVADFVTRIRRGDPPPVPGEDGRHLLAVLEAAYVSARDDRVVEIDDRLPAYLDP